MVDAAEGGGLGCLTGGPLGIQRKGPGSAAFLGPLGILSGYLTPNKVLPYPGGNRINTILLSFSPKTNTLQDACLMGPDCPACLHNLRYCCNSRIPEASVSGGCQGPCFSG